MNGAGLGPRQGRGEDSVMSNKANSVKSGESFNFSRPMLQRPLPQMMPSTVPTVLERRLAPLA